MNGTEAETDAHSVGSIQLTAEDREYLEALNDPGRIANKFIRGPQRLGYTSTICIILNRVIGTGIFRTPTTLMNGTQSVGVTLMFWFCGTITAIAGTQVMMEFGLNTPRYIINGIDEAVPRNGGELNYLQHLFRKPKYFVTCAYAVVFIVLGNMAGNSMAVGEYILKAANNDFDHSVSNGAVRGIAIGTITFACFLHGVWRKGGLWLNNAFAITKVTLLLIIIIIGFCALGGVFGSDANNADDNLNIKTSFTKTPNNAYGYAEGFLAIIFAYDGYNQANYVLSEIDQPRKKFKRSLYISIFTVAVLYMLVNISYMIVVDKNNQIGPNDDVALQFFQQTFGDVAPRVFAAFLAISGLGNIIVMTFTAARVKQEIAKEGVLPYAKFFGQSTNILSRLFAPLIPGHHHTPKTPSQATATSTTEPTPVGALCLHWFFSVLLILATWTMKPDDAYNILVQIYSYSLSALLYTILGLGLLWLRLRPTRAAATTGAATNPATGDWKTQSSVNHYLSILAATLFTLANLFPLLGSWIPPSTSRATPETEAIESPYPWFVVPTLGWALVGAGAVYWVGFRWMVPRCGGRRGKVFVVEREPFFHVENGYYVQWHEIVSFDWVVRMEGEGREEEW
ncbi:amino acid transporter [Saccharata proteae CBS 121410]|uniref:Amino acid transporter n=1 Tax=Saccharata proteae CBS 121410 TaxID=1314787 RepID=A0A9P4HYT0_9PEZI|nr:amino acid transporter [Saccharata proteae CBS 121410]